MTASEVRGHHRDLASPSRASTDVMALAWVRQVCAVFSRSWRASSLSPGAQQESGGRAGIGHHIDIAGISCLARTSAFSCRPARPPRQQAAPRIFTVTSRRLPGSRAAVLPRQVLFSGIQDARVWRWGMINLGGCSPVPARAPGAARGSGSEDLLGLE